MKFYHLVIVAAVIFFTSAVRAQSPARNTENGLQLSWRLLDNQYRGTGMAAAQFVLRNTGKKKFPASGWTIYFNSSQPVVSGEAEGRVRISHVNGDIFKMEPLPGFKAPAKNDSTVITYATDGTIINKTAAPSGPFLVWDKEPGKGYRITGYNVNTPAPSTPEMKSAEKIYTENSSLIDLRAEETAGIFPTPVYAVHGPGVFEVNSSLFIETDPAFAAEADFLFGQLKELRPELTRTVTAGLSAARVVLRKNQLPAEAYTLQIGERGAEISAASGAGIFYGIQSLLNLLSPDLYRNKQVPLRFPFIVIKDQPRFEYRSLLIDIARNFKTKETLLRVLDLMALYKMNVLHLHFNDDEGWRIQIPSLPELTDVGGKRGHSADPLGLLPPSYAAGPQPGFTQGSGYYTREEFVEILRYANVRHIQVIPEIESPGHARAAILSMLARYRRYLQAGEPDKAAEYLLSDPDDSSRYLSAQQWTDNVMCVARPSVYRFVETVVDELRAMYREAGAPLITIHMGGDEVPAGAWEGSPVCRQLVEADSSLQEINDLWYYYYGKVNRMLRERGLFLSGWEEAGMRKTKLDGKDILIVNGRMVNEDMQLHVWNNVTGWGAEDLPYKLANAGYKVILSPVSNNYLDLAYYKHPEEPGYYWGGFQDIEKPFSFVPFDYYRTSREDPDGNPVSPSFFIHKEKLTAFGQSNIKGIQGLLWAETLRSDEDFWYMLLPKLLGVAERAWAPDPDWAREKDSLLFNTQYAKAWNQFVNRLAKWELPRLDYYAGGYPYRIPPPGVKVENGAVLANTQFPGMQIRYTTDGSDPGPASLLYTGPVTGRGQILLRCFDTRGRGSRIILADNK
ncbi:MAG: carbohydate-binding domain-containing protein [Chitinophagaceae bacterium]|nr:carbohydate-binding domain-containing protein [Chitinophagaceae bacterium]